MPCPGTATASIASESPSGSRSFWRTGISTGVSSSVVAVSGSGGRRAVALARPRPEVAHDARHTPARPSRRSIAYTPTPVAASECEGDYGTHVSPSVA
ncbi:MAG: hypothetical protein MZV70_05595 [Desulfobacterales bacterium]|nr:hypothetical protein [Desulfobacterales bacterium]